MTNHIDYEQTIAAFIDGEPVAADRLRDALADPEEHEYLVDMVALRDLVAAEPARSGSMSAGVPASRRLGWRALAAAAALMLAASGGYLAGTRMVPAPGVTAVHAPAVSDAPPKPTVVVTVERWQDVQKGGGS